MDLLLCYRNHFSKISPKVPSILLDFPPSFAREAGTKDWCRHWWPRVQWDRRLSPVWLADRSLYVSGHQGIKLRPTDGTNRLAIVRRDDAIWTAMPQNDNTIATASPDCPVLLTSRRAISYIIAPSLCQKLKKAENTQISIGNKIISNVCALCF